MSQCTLLYFDCITIKCTRPRNEILGEITEIEPIVIRTSIRDRTRTWMRTMKTRKPSLSQFAICVENAEYPASLEMHKIYRVLPDGEAAEDGDVRIIDESGEDYLYPAEYFVVIQVPRHTARALAKSFSRSEQHAG